TRTQAVTVFLWTSRPAHRSSIRSIAAPPSVEYAGARRSIRVTTLLGGLGGTNAGCRKLPRQFAQKIPVRTDLALRPQVRGSRGSLGVRAFGGRGGAVVQHGGDRSSRCLGRGRSSDG